MFLPGRDIAGTSDPTPSAGSYEYSNSPELKALIAAANDNGRFDEGTTSDVTSMLLTVIASSTTISFLTYRCAQVQNWQLVPYSMWLVMLIHADCWLFVFTSAVLRYIIDYNEHSLGCGSAIHMCIFFFISNKLVSLFLVERAHVVLSRGARRLKSRLYVVNLTVVLLIYASCFSTFWPFHFNQIQDGLCFGGLKRAVLTTYIVADGVTNVYLTTLFLLPVIRSHSFGRGWRPGVWDERVPQLNSGLRELALRTFFGSLLSLGSITANMTIFAVLQIEPLWLCISTCQGDLLFTSIIIHWIAPGDRSTPSDSSLASRPSTPRMSRDINMRSVSINRGRRLSQPAPQFFEDAFYDTESDATSDAVGYHCQKVSSMPVEPDHATSPGGASTWLDVRVVPTDGLGRETSYNYASTSTEEGTIVESSSLADGEHLCWPRPALLRRPAEEAARVSSSTLSGQHSVEIRTK